MSMKLHVPEKIIFDATLITLKGWLIIIVPASESRKMPSRGQVSVAVSMNGHKFNTVLEPDGRGSHWLRVTDEIQQLIGAVTGDSVSVAIATRAVWPEPSIPKDVTRAIEIAPQKVQDTWDDITPMARWEWTRWINATNNDKTRAVRIEKTISKLNGSHRRPCCFNLAACTEPHLSKAGRLIEPAE